MSLIAVARFVLAALCTDSNAYVDVDTEQVVLGCDDRELVIEADGSTTLIEPVEPLN